MMETILILTSIIVLIIATSYDIKWRYVPDYASYSFIAISIIERILYAIEIRSLEAITWTATAVITLTGAGYLLYKSGMWGGGDVKIITSIAILLAWFPNKVTPLFIDFFINLTIIGAVYALPITLIIGLKKVKMNKKEKILMIIGLIAGITIYTLQPNLMMMALGLSVFMISIIQYISRVEKEAFIKPANMKTLMDGDWLIEEVKIGRMIIKPKKEGLNKKEAELIKKAWAQGKLKKKPLIKEGIAYLPAFLITMIITLTTGNLVLIMITQGL